MGGRADGRRERASAALTTGFWPLISGPLQKVRSRAAVPQPGGFSARLKGGERAFGHSVSPESGGISLMAREDCRLITVGRTSEGG